MSEVLPTSNGSSHGGVFGHFRTLSAASSRHQRRPTFPLAHSARRKPRRWPLALRFIKGAIHTQIILPVFLHALFTVLVVYLDKGLKKNIGLPSSIVTTLCSNSLRISFSADAFKIPSLSIVVGLMLVFRNGTSYERWWTGRSHLTTISTSIRNLTRSFLCCFYKTGETPTPSERADTERVVRILIAILYAIKNHLRAEWGVAIQPGTALGQHGVPTQQSEYSELLPVGLKSGETDGLGLPLELAFFVEKYIRNGLDRGWFHPPQASQMQMQLNNIVDAYGRMETIRLTPIPVAHLIHQKQVLALFGCILPFAMVDEMGWLAVPIVCIVTFTLYGIEGIGSQLEDPFGYDKNDIKMDAIVQDSRQEVMVMLEEWKKGGEMFIIPQAAVH